MVNRLSPGYLREFLDFLRSSIERTAAVYQASDLVGEEICERRLYTCACCFISGTEFLVRRSVWGVSRFFGCCIYCYFFLQIFGRPAQLLPHLFNAISWVFALVEFDLFPSFFDCVVFAIIGMLLQFT